VIAATTAAPGQLPAASVVIPTHNRRRQVERAVASVLGQTYENFELLVIDDGSRDGTAERLERRDQRLRYHWQANRGPSAARNTGIRLARHPVVAFLDADNYWLPDHLGTVVTLLARYPEAVLASTCPEFKIAGKEKPEDARLIDPLAVELVWNRTGYVSAVAARREALREVGGFDEQLMVGEDDDLWLRLAMNGRFATLRRRTIVRRRTRGGLRDRGRRGGLYTDANACSLRRALGELERQEGSRSRELIPRALARLHVLAVVSALERRDLDQVRVELASACGLAPELEENPGPILSQLWKSTHDFSELAHRVGAAGAAMPDPRSYSALYFRAYAAVLLLTRGRVWTAARLTLHRPHLVRRRFISRAFRPAAQGVRKRLVETIHSSSESPLAR
jgi:glycosyltransferase involved in cell wall biosynthesis